MRVSVLISTVLLGLVALSGCGPSRYYAYDTVAEREAYEREMREERARERRAARRARARAAARAKARRQRAQQVARSRPPASAPQPFKKPEPERAFEAETPRDTDKTVVRETARQARPPVAAAPVATPEPRADLESAAKPPPSEPVDEAAREAGRKQIEDGYRLLRAGFVKKARERFERAMGTNAAEASLGQARSMDPSYLKTVAFPDVIPNAEQARRMYRRAILLGNTEAKADLERLEKAMAAAAPTSVSPVSPAEAAPSEKSQ